MRHRRHSIELLKATGLDSMGGESEGPKVGLCQGCRRERGKGDQNLVPGRAEVSRELAGGLK